MNWKKRQKTESNELKNPVTLADMIHQGLSIFCWCASCGHNKIIDPVPITNILGPLFPVPKIGSRMRCSLCHNRNISTRPAWPNHGGGQYAHHT